MRTLLVPATQGYEWGLKKKLGGYNLIFSSIMCLLRYPCTFTTTYGVCYTKTEQQDKTSVTMKQDIPRWLKSWVKNVIQSNWVSMERSLL